MFADPQRRQLGWILMVTSQYISSLYFFLQVPLLCAAQEPDGDRRQQEPVGRNAEVHRRDPDLGRPKWQFRLWVSLLLLSSPASDTIPWNGDIGTYMQAPRNKCIWQGFAGICQNLEWTGRGITSETTFCKLSSTICHNSAHGNKDHFRNCPLVLFVGALDFSDPIRLQFPLSDLEVLDANFFHISRQFIASSDETFPTFATTLWPF